MTKARARWAGVVAACGVAAGALAVASPAGAQPVTETFEFTGAAQELVVPANVCQVTVDAFGAAGGTIGGAVPGTGGRATATLTVDPGETLQVLVGGQGADAADGGGGGAGFNGGGAGGDGSARGGAGGGGASDVRRAPFDLADRLVVAGGAGGRAVNAFGGAGGGEEGNDSLNAGGGSQTAGGAGGTGFGAAGVPGDSGSAGSGGDGGDGPGVGGGGGGGGWFGGGGGGGNESTEPGMSAGGGGGGSGFGPAGVAFETGVREGDGVVTITFDPDAGGCLAPGPAPVPIAATARFTG